MAYKLVCAETGTTCPFEVIATTRDELLEHVKVHAKMAHPEMTAPPDSQTISKFIHQV